MRAHTRAINCPKEWEADSDYSSHKPAIWLTLEKMKPVISVTEMGCGFGSTDAIRAWCKKHNAHFFSYETDLQWASRFEGVTLTKDYDDIHLTVDPHRQTILFIDSKPGEQRKHLVGKHSAHADVLVLHDTEPGCQSIYGITEVLTEFKYRLDYYPVGMPGTTILSNYVNVTNWIL